MLKQLQSALESIGERAEIIKALDHEKKEKDIIIIHHGNFNIILIPVNPTYVTLLMKIQLRPEDGAVLAKQTPEFHNEFGFILRRELMSGRSAFSMVYDESKKPAELREINLSQHIVIENFDKNTKQCISYAIQELVNSGLRVSQILGTTFSSIKGSTSNGKQYDGPMYG
ncbi:MAG: hypothetical protein AB1665_00020 [Candidatus Thermoplasmatota archaeon]